MDEKTTKIIKDKFDALPESIQEVILSSNYEETLLAIGTSFKNHLNVEQLGVLERETTLVMMGLTPTKDFQTELTRELNVDKEKGAQIVQEINEKIFLKIRDLLKLMNTPVGENPSVEEEDGLVPPSPTPPDLPLSREANGFPLTRGNKGVQEEGLGVRSLEGNNNDTQILSSAGIEIIPEKLELSTPSRARGEGSGVRSFPPILAQKLSGSVHAPVVETQHSLDNITKTNTPTPPSTPVSKPAIDPYREKPE